MQAITPLLFEIIWYLLGPYIWSRRSVTCKKDNICFIFFLDISPEQISKSNLYTLHHFLMVWNILIIFGRDIDKDQKRCVQDRQFSLSSLGTYLPWNRNLVQAFDIQVDGKCGPGRPKMTWKQLTERDRREWKLSAINHHDRHTWRSGACSWPAIWKGAHWCGCCPCTCTLIKNLIMIYMMICHNSHTVWVNLIIFGRDMYQVK